MAKDSARIRTRAERKEGVGLATYELDWSDPSKLKDDDLVDFIEGQFKSGKTRRQPWERQSAKQLSWCEGDQDQEFDNETTNDLITQVEKTIPLEYQQKVEINSLKGFIFQRIALLLGQPITLLARPKTNQPSDVNGANYQTKLLQYMWHTGDESVRKQLITALWMMFCTGVVWIHPYWDPFAGKKDQFGPKDMSKDDDEQTRTKKITDFKQLVSVLGGKSVDEYIFDSDGKIDIEMGEVRWEFRSGFDITEPEYTNKPEEAAWLIDSRWRSIEYMMHRYGKKGELVDPANAADAQYLAGYRSTYNPSDNRMGEDSNTAKPEIALTHTLWRPRAPWCEKGAMVVIADGEVMYKGFNPYAHGEIPLIMLHEMPSHRFRPRCTVYNMMKLQAARNRTRSQMAGAVHQIMAPKLLIEHGVSSAANAFDNQDRIIQIKKGTIDRVKYLLPPQLQGDMLFMDGLYRADLQDVSNVHDSTQGRGESKQQSGRHAAIVQQGDSRATLITRELTETGLSRAGAQSLWLWWQFVPTERTISIAGDEFGPEALSFKGSDLLGSKGEPGPADFNVLVEISTDNEPEQVLNRIQTMTEMGYWSAENPADRLRVSRLMGNATAVDHDDESRHRRNATIENEKFLKGDEAKDIRVNLGDNDEMHINEHYQFTTTDRYKEMVKNEPASKANEERLDFQMAVHIQHHIRQRAHKIIMPQLLAQHELARAKQALQAEGAIPPDPPPGQGSATPRQGSATPQNNGASNAPSQGSVTPSQGSVTPTRL